MDVLQAWQWWAMFIRRGRCLCHYWAQKIQRIEPSNLVSFLKITWSNAKWALTGPVFGWWSNYTLQCFLLRLRIVYDLLQRKGGATNWSKRKWRWCEVGCFLNLGIVGNMKMPVGTVKNVAPRWNNNTVPHFFYIAGPGFVQWTGWLVKYSELTFQQSTVTPPPPQNQHGTWKWTIPKGKKTLLQPEQLSGAMVILWWVSWFNGWFSF